MLPPMLARTFSALFLWVGFSLLLTGCATRDENEVSTIPWNRPQSWEGGGALGGFNTDYLNQ